MLTFDIYKCVVSSSSLLNGLLLHLAKYEPVSPKLYLRLMLKSKGFIMILACSQAGVVGT